MNRALRIAVIADDLTGAADTGVQFCPAVGPVLLTGAADEQLSDLLAPPAGLAVSTDSRHADARTAAAAVRRATELIGKLAPETLYKKIDSCLRGNLGAEIDEMLQAAGAGASFVAPAYPEQGRTTVDGIQRIDGIAVADTQIGRDPRCPVRQSHLPTLLSSQSRTKIGQIDLTRLEGPTDLLAAQVQSLLDHGCRHLVFDAEATEHLDSIAALAYHRFQDILPVGSAGLAGSLARVLGRELPPPQPPQRTAIKTWLFVCGSTSQVLAQQAALLARATGWHHLAVKTTVLAAAAQPSAKKQANGVAVDHEKGVSLILTIEPLPDSGPTENPDQVVRGLAGLAAGLLSVVRPDAVFLSGGDTAEAFRRQVGATGLLLREEILPGLVRGELVGGRCDGLPMVTKAGAFGQSETLIQLVNQLST